MFPCKLAIFVFLFVNTFWQGLTLTFTNHKGVDFLLKMMNKRVMVYHCKEAEEMSRKKGVKKLHAISLKCDVLGNVANITLQHNFQYIAINSDKRYRLIAQAHRGKLEDGRFQLNQENDFYFKNWIEYTLKIKNPRTSDSGLYRIQVQSPDGDEESQIIYVDLSPYEQHFVDATPPHQEKQKTEETVSHKDDVAKKQKDVKLKQNMTDDGHAKSAGKTYTSEKD